MIKVNLDAHIKREDFDVTGNLNSGNLIQTISVTDFTGGFFSPFLRKPDFQRETNEWDYKKIGTFLESFIEGDLIPAIILWRSDSGFFFVIDGSHRLSALIAWITDDYGDGSISQRFYDNNIPFEQINIANRTREYINKNIGSYQSIVKSSSNPDSDESLLRKARNLGAFSLQVQWVNGDSKKAENSFFKINQQGEPLNKTEIKLLKARKKPNCISARAIIRAGLGHKYWSDFSAEKQSEIQKLAKEIHQLFFNPTLNTPIKTLDLPIGGKLLSSQTLPMILEIINIVNKIPKNFKDKLEDDTTGEATLSYLRNVRESLWKINSVHPSSLGLHPIIYMYSQEGKHKIASLYAIVSFVKELSNRNLINDFIEVRKEFESILLEYDYLIQQINRKYRSAMASYRHIREFYFILIRELKSNKNIGLVINKAIKIEKYNFLTLSNIEDEQIERGFTTEKKSAVFIKTALKSALKCKICGGFIHKNSITIDHIVRQKDGGTGIIDNGQLAHPYCNTTYKN